MEGYKEIIISRKKSVLGCALAFGVELDGSPVGLIRNGEDLAVPATVGKHTLSFFKGRKLDASFNVSVSEEDTVLNIFIQLDGWGHIVSDRAQLEPGEAGRQVETPQGESQQHTYLFDSRGKLQLVGGLSNLPQGSICKVLYNPNQITFIASGQEFVLDASKMLDVSVMTPTEIQKQVVSSIGGAVAGAVLLGPLGAIIGGSASKKTVKNKKRYLVFTYISENETKYIVFDVTSNPTVGNSIKSTYRYLRKNEKVKINL